MNKERRKKIIQKIRDDYDQKEHSKLDELMELDKKVKLPVQVFAYAAGTVGALVFGSGMCIAMGVIGKRKIPGILIGCAGIAMVSINYPYYQKLLKARKEEYADRIIELSDQVIEES